MDADRIVEQIQAAERMAMNAAANVAAFLMAIRACEGTDGPDGYRAVFGYHPVTNPMCLFDDFSEHPFAHRLPIEFTQTDGTTAHTTAAGAYQYLLRTWNGMRLRLSLPDFSPPNQDKAAVQSIADRQALAAAKEGRFQDAIDKCAPEWASLPASRYLQPRRTLDFAIAAYEGAGGVLA